MTITPTALLSLPIITTGTESGTWGDVVDNGLTSYLDIAIAGGLAVSIVGTTTVTLTNTAGTSSATNIGSTTAQYAILNLSGAMTGACNLVLPSSSKTYTINNACTGGFLLTVKGAATTGVTLRNGESVQVAWNGSDFVKISSGVTGTGLNINIGLGTSALAQNTTGTKNIAIGYDALASNVNGALQVAVGYRALAASVGGVMNVAVGQAALVGCTGGSYNVGVGANAIGNNLNGTFNTAIGTGALQNATAPSECVAIGTYALLNVTTGKGNTAITPNNSAGTYQPVFDPTTENNRFCAGSLSVTNAYVQVAWTVVSDARDKTDFADVPHGLDFVSKLQPTAYRYKMYRDDTEGHGPVRYGFKAQDVLALEGETPVIVDAEDTDKLRFNDQALLAVLVNAIKELKAEFDAYKAAHA